MKRSKDRKPNRLSGYDYSQPGWYFVTICVGGMRHLLGDAREEKMVLSEAGKLV